MLDKTTMYSADFKRGIVEEALSGQHTVMELALERGLRSATIHRWMRQFESDQILQLHAGITKASERLKGLLKEWREGRLTFEHERGHKSGSPSASESELFKSAIMNNANMNATQTGHDYLQEIEAPLLSFMDASHSKGVLFRTWRNDLYKLFRRIARHKTRWQPRLDEMSLLVTALPQRARNPIPSGAGSARRRLHGEAERWARSIGQVPQAKYSLEQSLWDSYWTVDLTMREVREYKTRISELYDSDIYDIDNHKMLLSPVVGQRVERELDFLLALLELRRGIDVQRSLLLRSGALRPYVPFEIDAEFRTTFERILQGVPMHVGVTPDRGTHDYARSRHFARELVVEPYARIHALSPSMPAQYYPASSAMALLSDLLIFSISTMARPVRIGYLEHSYFETHEFLGNRLGFLKGRFKLIEIPQNAGANKYDLDVVLLETIGNHPKGIALDDVWVRKFLRNLPAVKIVIIDITLDPFRMQDYARYIPKGTVFVAIDSLTKYAQAGTNVAIGGMATIIAGKSGEAKKRAEQLWQWLQDMTRLLGQHMDPRLAISLVPSREILKERIHRMRRNASLIAQVFRKMCAGNVRHASSGKTASTMVYLKGCINWGELKTSELARFHKERRITEEHRAELLTEYKSNYIRPEGEGDKTAAIVRLSTSFGFSVTSVHIIEPKKAGNEFWIRVSAGIESLEHLDYLIEFRLDSLLPFLTKDWESYYHTWPHLIPDRDNL